MGKMLWMPDAARIQQTNLTRFMAQISASESWQGQQKPASYDDLHAYSLTAPEAFWSHLWSFADVKGDKGKAPYLVDGDRMPGARFFPDGTLNFAENLLRKDGDETALVFWGEEKVKRRVSWSHLRAQVSGLQRALEEAGVARGDRVAAMLPNLPEAIAGVLGTASIGAVWSSCSPDFGTQGVLDRFGQVEPKVLIACDGYFYNGKTIDISDKLEAIVAALPTVRSVIVVSYTGQADAVATRLDRALAVSGRRASTWQTAVTEMPPRPPVFVPLPFAHPLYILFSSGTTGVPKCIVHSAGGTLLKHLSEHVLHSDVKPDDRVFYFTTLGWMMWNWLVSGLSAGATLLLYDGSPFHPGPNILWDYAAEEKATHFGTSAKYIDALKKAGAKPADTHDLASLKAILSTGSPLAPESFNYVYDGIKRDVHLASISGGTDIVGCFVLGIPTKPVFEGEIQGPGLGMASDVFDANGKPLTHGKGELVCTKPFPSMPLMFWNDTDGAKYRAAYFSRFPNVWHHGDFAEWTEHGGMIIHGRSDATLNPGGVRIGTAEIYRQVEQLPEVQEAIVIGQDWDHDVRVVLFVILKSGFSLDAGLIDRIKRQIRQGASPRHVPAKVIQIADIPRTKSGKITELAVRDVVMGREIKNKEALANPEALALYEDLPELRT